MKEYICLDIETTGLNPKIDRVIEIGAVRMRDGEVADTFARLINPGRKLEEHVINLTGLRDEDLCEKPLLCDVLPDLTAFLSDIPLLGHRIIFDYSFLKKAYVNEKLTFEKTGVDTLWLARKYCNDAPSKKLSDLCALYKIPHNPHRALDDALATAAFYELLKKRYLSEETANDFLPKPLIYQVKRDTPITKAQIERLGGMLIKHGIEPDYDIKTLTRSEASRIMDRITATFGR